MTLLTLAGCAPEAGRSSSETPSTPSTPSIPSSTADPALFAALEERFGANLGVYAIDTATGATVEYNADDRFGFASTIKALAVGAVLDTATAEELREPIPVHAEDLVPYSPVIEPLVGATVTLLDAADAAVRFSDNTAANLLVEYLGGPAVLEQQLRAVGDATTNVDRIEPDLNDVVPGDDRDTSTPRALATTLAAYALSGRLDPEDRTLLVDLLQNNTTGDALLRAGAPTGWTIGDKTGTASYGTRNDIAIAWPPSGEPPIVIAVLTNRAEAEADAEPEDALLAEAAALVFEALATD
ncbi:MAG TPA: class A beta-lactamase [Plantibacter sp.]|uniref:class A beta-lactamase n=1 Tax=unclassified Plantibacter TaxID=2624265 RepID=UPI002BA78447|nr:class A beta-lactamase [Plantibacter sp.]